jgi:hypothetical protein
MLPACSGVEHAACAPVICPQQANGHLARASGQDAKMAKVKAQAAPSPFGKNAETVVDENVR